MSTPPFGDMSELVQRLLDDQIQPDEMKRLQEALLKDPKARRYYLDSMFACAVMRHRRPWAGGLSESDLMRALSRGESRGGSKRVVRHLYSVAAVLVIGVLALASATLFRHRNQGLALGTLAGAYEAQWEGARPRPGESLYARLYDLREGLARMELGQGASLLLEAPCRLELKSGGEVTLTEGTLTVSIAPQSTGFRVRTPTALITDLGTQFGVIAHADGSTETDVLKGQVIIALDPNRSGRSTSLVVNERRAVVIDATGRTIQAGLAARADLFLLQLPSVSQPSSPARGLNLADIVGGGNGRGTGIPDRGIDLRTGQGFDRTAASMGNAASNEFRRCPQFRAVDGVFVPNGAAGPIVISSTGLRFPQCPTTMGNCYDGPLNGGKFFDSLSRRIYTARLNGVSFGTSAHPALILHPNAGITFDLDQIRQDHPNTGFDRFTAVCGIPKDVPQPRPSSADVWVLLDGVVRLHLHYPVESSVVENVEVPIPDEARFLTLVTTCPGSPAYSWILFGDPSLE